MSFELSEQHIPVFLDGSKRQKQAHLFFREIAGGAVRSVREDVEPAGIFHILVAGKPNVASFCDQTNQKEDHGGCRQPERCEDSQPVAERIEDPNAPDHVSAGAESGVDPQPEGVQEHPVGIPDSQTHRDVNRKLLFMAIEPAPAFQDDPILQLFQQL